MQEINAKSGLDAQTKLAELVRDAKLQDPFRHITLLVESNHQALQFRRQLVRSLHRIGAPSALVAFSALTKIELVTYLARLSGFEWNYENYEKARQLALRELLVNRNDVFKKLSNHAESFETILNYTRQFDWQRLTPDLISTISSATKTTSTRLSIELLEGATDLQEALRLSAFKSPADVIQDIRIVQDQAKLKKMESILGLVVSLVSDYPLSLELLVDGIAKEEAHARLSLKPEVLKSEVLKVKSYPDPETEVKSVVREVAHAIGQGSPVEQLAVLYTDAAQYAEMLAHEFEAADIGWNGISTDSPAITRAAVATRGYFQVAYAILSSGTFTKADLSILFRLASIQVGGEELRTGPLEKFIRKTGLFNEAANWVPQLQATHGQLNILENHLNDLVTWNADEVEIEDCNFRIRDAKQAGALVQVIAELVQSVEKLKLAKNNQELADVFWQEVNAFFPQISDGKMPVERLAYEKLTELFESQHSAVIDSLESTCRATLGLFQSVFLRLTNMKLQHGELSRGVYVGPVSQNGALHFANVWVVGAGDGMLPQAISEDPIFPDDLKSQLEELNSFRFARVDERVAEINSNYLSVVRGANNVVVTYPKGGTLAKTEGEASPWLSEASVHAQTVVKAATEFRLEETGAISHGDLLAKVSAMSSTHDTNPSETLSAAKWFAYPESSKFVGNLAESFQDPIVNFSSMTFSASTAEKFLKCNHNFFTTKILGVSDREDEDVIDEVRAVDFGKAVHKAFERLLLEAPELNPTFGEPYSADARERFKDIFEEECNNLVARGQSGWAPIFESSKRNFIELIDLYFEIEAFSRNKTILPNAGPRGADLLQDFSADNLLRPQLAEFAFEKQGDGLLPVTVTTGNHPSQILRFKGSIDRVDISANGEHVGVLDFKTGKKANIDKNSAIQDLLYEKAIRHSTAFLGVKKVSSRYLFLSKKEKDSGLRDIRADRDRRVFLSTSNGGVTGSEYVEAVALNREKAEAELQEKLALLVTASFERKFLTHNLEDSEASLAYCLTCKKLGVKQIAQLSSIQHPPKPISPDQEEENN